MHTEHLSQQQKEDIKMKWMVQETLNDEHEDWIAQQMRDGQSIMVASDGSFHPEHKVGTSSWVITSETDTSRQMHGDNVMPGAKCFHCPHRSELGGLIGAVKHINDMCKRHNIVEGNVEIACDGLDACKVATRYEWTHATNMGHYDLASCLYQLLRQSKLSWTFRHARGYQDKIKSIDEMDIWEKLNMVADAHAKIALQRHIERKNGETVNMRQLQNALLALKVEYSGDIIAIASNLRKRLKNHIAQEWILQY